MCWAIPEDDKDSFPKRFPGWEGPFVLTSVKGRMKLPSITGWTQPAWHFIPFCYPFFHSKVDPVLLVFASNFSFCAAWGFLMLKQDKSPLRSHKHWGGAPPAEAPTMQGHRFQTHQGYKGWPGANSVSDVWEISLFAFWNRSCDWRRQAEAISTLPNLWAWAAQDVHSSRCQREDGAVLRIQEYPSALGELPKLLSSQTGYQGPEFTEGTHCGAECPYQPRDRDSGTSAGLTKGQDDVFLLWNHTRKNLHMIFFLSNFLPSIFICCNVWIRTSWFTNVSVLPGCSLPFPVGNLATQFHTQHSVGRRNEVW